MRDGMTSGSRPMLGRRPQPSRSEAQTTLSSNPVQAGIPDKPVSTPSQTSTNLTDKPTKVNKPSGGNIQTPQRPQRSTRNPNPNYVGELTHWS